MKITPEMVEFARTHQACSGAIAYVEAHLGEEFPSERSLWVDWLFRKRWPFSDADFAQVVQAAPWAALRYAADRLTPDQFDACSKAAPAIALEFAAARLTEAQFAECSKAQPETALIYALDRLTPEQFDACSNVAPWAALRYAADRLTAEQAANFLWKTTEQP